MATIHKPLKHRPLKPRSRILTLLICVAAIALLCLFSSRISFSSSGTQEKLHKSRRQHSLHDKYLYWGNRIDCPGKHCESCEGLGHQESSLRCALEEAMFLNRTFVMPSRMCINPIHNKKGILHQSHNASSEERWAASSCSLDSLYDMDLISETVPVILDNSKDWYRVLSTSMKLGARGVAHVEGVSRVDLKENSKYSNLLLINRTASPLSWFMECKDRNNLSAIMLPYSFLPSMAADRLRNAADKVGIRHTFPLCKQWVQIILHYASQLNYLRAQLWLQLECALDLLDRKGAIEDYDSPLYFQVAGESYGDLGFGFEDLKIKALLGDYDAIHVRRGDKIKTRKDRFGVDRTLHPHLDRDTRPEFILHRIEKWVPPGRTLFIASNEKIPGFFSPLSVRYKLVYSSNYSRILDSLIENNYQLFMVERLILMDAKTFIRTFKADDSDLSLTDDPKKNTKLWQIPVYTLDEEGR